MLPTESNLYMLLILTVPLQKDTNNIDLLCCFLNVLSLRLISLLYPSCVLFSLLVTLRYILCHFFSPCRLLWLVSVATCSLFYFYPLSVLFRTLMTLYTGVEHGRINYDL